MDACEDDDDDGDGDDGDGDDDDDDDDDEEEEDDYDVGDVDDGEINLVKVMLKLNWQQLFGLQSFALLRILNQNRTRQTNKF